MNDELERLREVARAAAALLRAEVAYQAHVGPVRDRFAETAILDPDLTERSRQLAADAADREEELVRALARLAEVDPGYAPPT